MNTTANPTNLRTLKTTELVTLYNTAAEKLGMRPVNKFSDKETAIARVRTVMAKVGTEVTVEEVRRVSSFPPAPAPAPEPANSPVDAAPEPSGEIALRKARASVAPPKGERLAKPVKAPRVARTTITPGPMDNLPKAANRMSFNFKPVASAHEPKGNGNSLRSLCFARMLKGCTFADVVTLVKDFDAGRGKGNAGTVERRAYELVRLMHYALGYGINHDEATGQISLYK